MSLPRMCEIESPLHRELTVVSAGPPKVFTQRRPTSYTTGNDKPLFPYKRENVNARKAILDLIHGKSLLCKPVAPAKVDEPSHSTDNGLTDLPIDLTRASSSKFVKLPDEDSLTGKNTDLNMEHSHLRKGTVTPRTVVLDIDEPQDNNKVRKGILRTSVTRSAPAPSTGYQLADVSTYKESDIPVKFRISSSRTTINTAVDNSQQMEKERYKAKRRQQLLLSTSVHSNFALLLREAVKPPAPTSTNVSRTHSGVSMASRSRLPRQQTNRILEKSHHSRYMDPASIPTLRMDNEESSFTRYVRLNKSATRRLDGNGLNLYGNVYW